MAIRWRVALLVCAAIAISYLDRQSLPVAVAAIQLDIPLTNTQFGALSSVFLFAYALAYAGGGVLSDRLGSPRRPRSSPSGSPAASARRPWASSTRGQRSAPSWRRRRSPPSCSIPTGG